MAWNSKRKRNVLSTVPVDGETEEDEDNNNRESSKGPSNADTFSELDTVMEWYELQSECCPTQLLLLERIGDIAAKKTKVYNAQFPLVMIFNIRVVSGFVYCMDRIRFSVIRTRSDPNRFG
ncbi:hypothetical protein TNCV_3105731 [Trichonephila clavipes]|nr:hypothetical protein TNCV_3105731 [Trichonephila clavipes]